jgi:hypothetical protein
VSNALAISGVSAVLQSMFYSVYNGAGLGTVKVSAVAPDLAQGDVTGASDVQLMVNLFLHQVTLNPAWRNVGHPKLAADGVTQLKNPPLALDLHYLLTAYASIDFQAEALLGFGIQMLHETPVLTRGQISNALNSGLSASDPSNPLLGALGASGLADQVEMIKITPATLGREEMAWLWTALKADYRPTFPFQVSVVLIQSQVPLVSALPVLTRAVAVQTGLALPLPTLTAAAAPNAQPAACLGDIVTVSGTYLLGATGVTLSNALLGINQSITPASNVAGGSFTFVVPDPAAPPAGSPPTDIPAGVYLMTAQVLSGGSALSTNSVSLAIAPKIAPSWAPVPIASGTAGTLTVPCTPFLRPTQEISLLIGGQEIPVVPFEAPTNTPSFAYSNLQPTGIPVPVWLSVDGVLSPIIDMTSLPSPTFAKPKIQVT